MSDIKQNIKHKKILIEENIVDCIVDKVNDYVGEKNVRVNDIKKELNEEKKSGLKTKANIFKKEREQILEKVSKIIQIDGTKGGFICLGNINEDQKKEVLSFYDDYKKYYVYAQWGCFKEKNIDKAFVSVIKCLYKEHNFDVRQSISYKKKNKVTTKIATIFIEKQE